MKRTYSILAAMILATTARRRLAHLISTTLRLSQNAKGNTILSELAVEDSSLKMVGHGTAVLNALEAVRLPT